jgi:hypothetical protein
MGLLRRTPYVPGPGTDDPTVDLRGGTHSG